MMRFAANIVIFWLTQNVSFSLLPLTLDPRTTCHVYQKIGEINGFYCNLKD